MRRCFACKMRISWGDEVQRYGLDDVDREILGLGDNRKTLYFHSFHFVSWYEQHMVVRELYYLNNSFI
jgi:hypothetical protein